MYTADRIIPMIVLTSSNNELVVDEGSGPVTVTVPAGNYWGHNDSSLNATYPGLYKAIVDAMNASALTYTYSVEAFTPTLSTEQENGGLRFYSGAATDDFDFDLSSGSWTLDPGLIGFADNSVITAADVSSSGGYLTSTLMRSAEWITNTYFSTKTAEDKRSHTEFDQRQSDEDSAYAYSYDWSPSEAGMIFRKYIVKLIPAAHIIGSRALDYDYADTALVAHGDANNGFIDIVWDRARNLYGEGTEGDVLIVYNSTDDLQVDAHDYDVARIAKVSDRQKWKDTFLTTRFPNGEFYDMDLLWRIKVNNYIH